MAAAVLDASVAALWFFEEGGSDGALALLASDVTLAAPDLLVIEVASVARKRALRGEITRQAAAEIVERLLSFPVHLRPSGPLAARALGASLWREVGVFDAVYALLADDLDATLVTADARLGRALRSTMPRLSVEVLGAA